MNNQLTDKELFSFLAGDPKQRSISGLCEYVSGYFGREMSDFSEDVIVGAWEMKPIEMEVDDDDPQAQAVERTVKEAQTQTRSARS